MNEQPRVTVGRGHHAQKTIDADIACRHHTRFRDAAGNGDNDSIHGANDCLSCWSWPDQSRSVPSLPQERTDRPSGVPDTEC
jgi:hypothetical protein